MKKLKLNAFSLIKFAFIPAALLLLWAIIQLANTAPQNLALVSSSMTKSVWQLDAAVHRMISGDNFPGEPLFENDKRSLADALASLKKIAAKQSDTFAGTTDAVEVSAASLLAAVELGDKRRVAEHLKNFRNAVSVVEAGILPAGNAGADLDENDKSQIRRADSASYMAAASLLLFALAFVTLKFSSSLHYRYQALSSKAKRQNAELTEFTMKLVEAENILAALRGDLKVKTKEIAKIQQDLDFQKSETQKQMLARSALERQQLEAV